MTRPSQRALDLASAGLEELGGLLRRSPPAGVTPQEVDKVFERHRAPLLSALAEGNWKGGAVMRDGEPFAQIRNDGRIFNCLIGGEIDAQGNPIERLDISLALVRAGGQSVGYSDGPKVAGELSGAAEKRGQRP